MDGWMSRETELGRLSMLLDSLASGKYPERLAWDERVDKYGVWDNFAFTTECVALGFGKTLILL